MSVIGPERCRLQAAFAGLRWLTLVPPVLPFSDPFGSVNMPCCDELLMDYSGSLFCKVDPILVI
jgi:hypothetical protein